MQTERSYGYSKVMEKYTRIQILKITQISLFIVLLIKFSNADTLNLVHISTVNEKHIHSRVRLVYCTGFVYLVIVSVTLFLFVL